MAERRGLGRAPGLGRPFDSVNKVAHITAPTLFIHGAEAAIVPYEQGYALYRAFPGNKTFKKAESAGHTGLIRQVGDEYWRRMREFVAQ